MEEEVGGQTPRGIRVDPALAIAKGEGGHGGCARFVHHVDHDLHRGDTLKENRNGVAEADVLCSLTDIEGKFGLPGALVAAVDLQDPVF